MSDLEPRLARCFAAVFPSLNSSAIVQADRENVPDWDSLASITLVRVIEEEFGITFKLLDLEDLNGFPAFREYLAARVP